MASIDESAMADVIESAAEIVAAYVSNNTVPTAELGALIGNVHRAWPGPPLPVNNRRKNRKNRPCRSANP